MAQSLCADWEEDMAEHCGMYLSGLANSEFEVLCSALTFFALSTVAAFATP